jgi:CheY-like chemotaxis protein
LPGKNGYEVARELRTLPEMHSTLLVALTGYGHDDDRRRANEAGFDAFQVKPVAPDALESLLTDHFAARKS